MIFANKFPARLNVLLEDMQVIMRVESGKREAAGVWPIPLRDRSQWISSDITQISLARQISIIRLSSSGRQTRPVGLCGLHRKRIFTRKSAWLALRVKSSQSGSQPPADFFNAEYTTRRWLYSPAFLNGPYEGVIIRILSSLSVRSGTRRFSAGIMPGDSTMSSVLKRWPYCRSHQLPKIS